MMETVYKKEHFCFNKHLARSKLKTTNYRNLTDILGALCYVGTTTPDKLRDSHKSGSNSGALNPELLP